MNEQKAVGCCTCGASKLSRPGVITIVHNRDCPLWVAWPSNARPPVILPLEAMAESVREMNAAVAKLDGAITGKRVVMRIWDGKRTVLVTYHVVGVDPDGVPVVTAVPTEARP